MQTSQMPEWAQLLLTKAEESLAAKHGKAECKRITPVEDSVIWCLFWVIDADQLINTRMVLLSKMLDDFHVYKREE